MVASSVGVLGRWMLSFHSKADKMNKQNILRLLEPIHRGKFVDLGCNDAAWTREVARALGVSEAYGVDLDSETGRIASSEGVGFLTADLNQPLPFRDGSMDVVHSNQVIEHLQDVDTFLEEIYRILRPGGYTIISTENLSSLDNLLALVLGQQAFSQHISGRYHVGNRFSPHYGEAVENQLARHRTIFTFDGITQLIRRYDFKIEAELGAGYPPFPAVLANLDPVHARFITVKARKPSG